AILFPNISPYDRQGVVVSLSREPFLSANQFTAAQLADGLLASIGYFRSLPKVGRGTHSVITWNYMPPAGATQVHAHFQAFSTNRPGWLLEEEVRRSRLFWRRHHHPYWQELADTEEASGERFVAGGRVALAAFHEEGVRAFNLAFYGAPSQERTPHFWLHARVSPRIYFSPAIRGSDNTSWQHLLDEPFMVRSPEALAERLRDRFRPLSPPPRPK